MFRQNTVFVVGAGASCELGLPSGDTLMDSIAQHLAPNTGPHGFSHDGILVPLMKRAQEHHGIHWVTPMQSYRDKAIQMRKALPYARSIDTYLESQRDDPDLVYLGKLAIAQAILQAERGSHLSPLQGDDGVQKLRKTWYPALGRILTAGHHRGNIGNLFSNVSFIVFNYDRCLETFLLRMIRDYFGIEDEAAKVFSSATIVHAYGQVGSLIHDRKYVPFGGSGDVDLNVVAEGIKTYTESADAGTTERIRSLVKDANTIVFMGFGYLAQNLQLLSPDRGSGVKQVIATAYNMSTQDREAISGKLLSEFGEIERYYSGERLVDGGRRQSFRTIFELGTCRDLMSNNIFSLADQ